jgi:hypothetical protein
VTSVDDELLFWRGKDPAAGPLKENKRIVDVTPLRIGVDGGKEAWRVEDNKSMPSIPVNSYHSVTLTYNIQCENKVQTESAILGIVIASPTPTLPGAPEPNTRKGVPATPTKPA